MSKTPHSIIKKRERQAKEELTASLMNTDDAAPFHLGSLSGKICPISGSPNAPNIASTTQCSNTSPRNMRIISIYMAISCQPS